MSDATSDYKLLQTLTDAQRNAIGLLIEGKRDAQVAEEVGVHRVTVARWRLYNPAFQAALNQKRRQLWDEMSDRIGSLLPQALDAIARQLGDEKRSLGAAAAILRMAGVARITPPCGATEADEIIEQLIDERFALIDRQAVRSLGLAERNAEIASPNRRRVRESNQRQQAQREVLERLRELGCNEGRKNEGERGRAGVGA